MELSIVDVYSEEQEHLMYVNKQIKDRIETLIEKYYNVKYDNDKCDVYIYKKPIYEANKHLNNIIKFITYNINCLINLNKYYIMMFTIEDNKIIVNVYGPKQVKKYQMYLNGWFNSIEDVEVIIQKQYPAWKYEQK